MILPEVNDCTRATGSAIKGWRKNKDGMENFLMLYRGEGNWEYNGTAYTRLKIRRRSLECKRINWNTYNSGMLQILL